MLGMNDSASRQGCLSDLVFDRHLVGELAAAPTEAMQSHLARCPGCTRRMEQLSAERATLAADAELPALAQAALHAAQERAVPPARGHRPRWALARRWAAVGALACAALMALVFVGTGERPGTRSKGARISLGGYLRDARGQVRPLGPRQRVSAGDQLRFSYASAEPSYLTIVGLDALGHVEVYEPVGGAPPALTGAQTVLSSHAIELDRAPGVERILGVFCHQPVPAAIVEAHARTALTQARGDPEGIHALDLPCAYQTLSLEQVTER